MMTRQRMVVSLKFDLNREFLLQKNLLWETSTQVRKVARQSSDYKIVSSCPGKSNDRTHDKMGISTT